MRDRICRRPYRFTAWIGSLALLVISLATFQRGLGYFGETKQILLISGGLLIQPVQHQPTIGWRTFLVTMPARNHLARVTGYFLWSQGLGTAYWFPLGTPLVATTLVTTWLFWRRLPPPKGHCQKCGYDLKGNESGVCPECGIAAMKVEDGVHVPDQNESGRGEGSQAQDVQASISNPAEAQD